MAILKRADIVGISFVGHRPAIMHLVVGGQTPDGQAANQPFTGQGVCRILQTGSIIWLWPIQTVAGGIKDDDMDVNLPSAIVGHEEVEWSSAFRAAKTGALERRPQPLRITVLHDEINVVVGSTLGAEQRVDPPAPIDPDGDVMRLQEEQDLERIRLRQVEIIHRGVEGKRTGD